MISLLMLRSKYFNFHIKQKWSVTSRTSFRWNIPPKRADFQHCDIVCAYKKFRWARLVQFWENISVCSGIYLFVHHNDAGKEQAKTNSNSNFWSFYIIASTFRCLLFKLFKGNPKILGQLDQLKVEIWRSQARYCIDCAIDDNAIMPTVNITRSFKKCCISKEHDSIENDAFINSHFINSHVHKFTKMQQL